MRYFNDPLARFATDPLRRGVGCDELRVLGFELLELLDQFVKIEVGDFRVVEHEIAVFMMTDPVTERLDVRCHIFPRTCHGHEIIFVDSARLLGIGSPWTRNT